MIFLIFLIFIIKYKNMGLLDKLQQGDSTLTSYNGNTPPVNPLATAQSKMHDSYSITGQNIGVVNTDYHAYNDGVNQNLPSPSQLDLGGIPPKITPTGQALPYTLNQPR
jgi:hypothetical protein